MKYCVLFLGLVLCVTCTEKPTEEFKADAESIEPMATRRVLTRDIPDNLLTIDMEHSDEPDVALMENYLFGKFFCDRAEFYVVDRPTNKIYDTGIEVVTLYYLDGQLRQTKCVLESNVASRLVKKLGKFSIIAYDDKNKFIVDSGKVVMKTDDGMALNEALDNYELVWKLGEREVIYRVNMSREARFQYTERASDFEYQYWRVQNSCI